MKNQAKALEKLDQIIKGHFVAGTDVTVEEWAISPPSSVPSADGVYEQLNELQPGCTKAVRVTVDLYIPIERLHDSDSRPHLPEHCERILLTKAGISDKDVVLGWAKPDTITASMVGACFYDDSDENWTLLRKELESRESSSVLLFNGDGFFRAYIFTS